MANELDEDPERTETFLAEVHREAEAEIEAAGGTVERGIAGALIATFGAAHAREEDHALRAVSAALATRKRLGEVFGETLWVRMSVESGEVILGRPGSFVTGTPVVAAARLVRSAGPNEIVVGERAATATAGAFDLQQRDGAYLLGAALAPTRSPAQIAAGGGDVDSCSSPARSSSSPRSPARPSSPPATRPCWCRPTPSASSIPRRTRWLGTCP